MSWLTKLGIGKKKDVISGPLTLEVFNRLISPEFNSGEMIGSYTKSLYVFACVSKIAEKVASVELKLFKILNSKGDTKEILTHPLLDLLYKVNPFQTKTEFLETTMINLKTTGDAFWLKVRNKGGRPVELWNLRPDMVTIVTDPMKFIAGYKYQKQNGTSEELAPEDVIHFKYPDPMSQYTGVSPIRAASRRIQTEDFATAWQRDFFLNSARPDALIKNPNTTLTPEQKDEIRIGWNKRHRGRGKNSSVAILEGGLDYQQISLSQHEMDYIESLKSTRDDILAAFKVPKPIVAIVDDVNRANSETAMFIFLSETIKPEMLRLVEKINEELVIPDFGDEFVVDFEDPTPANRELELKQNAEGIQNNYLLINEVRTREGLPPVKGGWSLYMPLMNQAVGGLPQNVTDKAIKLAEKNSDENEKIIKANQPKKIFSFKGKYMLKKKFEIKEQMIEEVKAALSLKKKTKNKKFVSLLPDAEVKKVYAKMLLKKLDAETAQLTDGMNGFADEQQKRVQSKMDSFKSEKAVKLTVDQIFNKKGEYELTVAFVTPYIESFLKKAGQDALSVIAPQEDFSDSKEIRKLIRDRAKLFGKTVTATTVDKLSNTLAQGIAEGEGIIELSDRVNDVYKEFSTYRSDMIARTETTAANAKGNIEGFRQSGVANAKEWINSGDARVREEHEDIIGVGGEIVLLDDAFSNGLQAPSEPNCRCVLGPAFKEE